MRRHHRAKIELQMAPPGLVPANFLQVCAGNEVQGQADLVRLAASASGRGSGGMRDEAAPQSQDRAPNGAAQPCACRLPGGAHRH